MFFSGVALQGVSGARRRTDGEAEAAPHPHDIHIGAAQGTGEGLPGDALSRHIHERGDRHEDRPHRGKGPGRRKQTSFSHHNITSYINNSIQFFVIYMPSQQLQGQLQTQYSVGTIIMIMMMMMMIIIIIIIQFFIINVPSQQQTPITETAQCVYNIT
jgi:hypothetical protein